MITALLILEVLMFCWVLYLSGRVIALNTQVWFLKDALCYLMVETNKSAVEVEGYTEGQVFAMRRGARELGIKWSQEIDPNTEETVYKLVPSLTDYRETLRKNSPGGVRLVIKNHWAED